MSHCLKVVEVAGLCVAIAWALTRALEDAIGIYVERAVR